MDAKDAVLEILYFAFLQIRAHPGKTNICHPLADVLHNVPAQIGRAMDGKMT